MKIHLLAMSVALFCSVLAAQDMPNAALQQTAPPANARYEIVQSPIVARETFRLNRFTGEVSQLVKSSMG
ncbi:MAG TPA: hypothetical protein VFM84_04780, partial [Holophagaceae bacterium]|nr:hypothetical protein [Holophagaceae bacterium]